MNFNFFQIFAFANLYNIIQLEPSKAAVSFSRQDRYLTNHVLRRFPEKKDWLDCTLACEKDPECISYNYRRSARICELNSNGVVQVCGNTESELVLMEGWLYHQIKPAVTKTLNKPPGLRNRCDCNCGTSRQCPVERPKLGDSPENPARSCLDILRKRGNVPNGPYYLSTATGGRPVYCHMEQMPVCDGAGWTLVMKIDGKKTTFGYSSQFWTNTETYKEEHGLDLAETETKLATFVAHQPENGYCVGMRVNGETKWTLVRWTSDTLYVRIKSSSTTLHHINIAQWESLVTNSSMQSCGENVGFNMKARSPDGARARLGLAASNCTVYGSRLGFGTSGSAGGVDDSNSCGNEASRDSSHGARSIKAFCYIFVK